MVTHAEQPVQHPVQMPGHPRRLYLLGALGSTMGAMAFLAASAFLMVPSAAFVLLLVLACGAVAGGRYLIRASMWHVRTRDLDRLPHWPAWVRWGVESALVVAVATVSMRSGNGLIQLVWVMVAAMIAVMALCSVFGWAVTMTPGPRWLTAINIPRADPRDAARSASKLTVGAVLICVTVWMNYDVSGITEMAVASARSAGWSQSRIDAIPDANYWIMFAEVGALAGLVATGFGWAIRVGARKRHSRSRRDTSRPAAKDTTTR